MDFDMRPFDTDRNKPESIDSVMLQNFQFLGSTVHVKHAKRFISS